MLAHDHMLPCGACIAQIVREGADVKRFVLDTEIEAMPGQFIMVWLPGLDEKPFSLASGVPVAVVVAKVGPFTRTLHDLRVGDRLWWRGPLGHGFTLPNPDVTGPVAKGTLLLVGGGYGAAPLAFLAERASSAGWQVMALLGARSESGLILRERFAALGCRVIICTEDGSCGQQGLITEAAEGYVGHSGREKITAVYGCGPLAMLEALRPVCGEHRVPCQLSYEAFIKCGMGVCGSCAWNGLLICHDGPVIRYSASGEWLSPHDGDATPVSSQMIMSPAGVVPPNDNVTGVPTPF